MPKAKKPKAKPLISEASAARRIRAGVRQARKPKTKSPQRHFWAVAVHEEGALYVFHSEDSAKAYARRLALPAGLAKLTVQDAIETRLFFKGAAHSRCSFICVGRAYKKQIEGFEIPAWAPKPTPAAAGFIADNEELFDDLAAQEEIDKGYYAKADKQESAPVALWHRLVNWLLHDPIYR